MSGLEKIYSDLLSASAGEISFDRTIETITNCFGAGGGVVFELNRRTGEILNWATPSLIIGGDDGYNEHLNAINPRMRFSMRYAPGHIAYDGRFISERDMDRHEFYDWLRGLAGFRYMLGSRLYDDGDVSVFHSVEFSTQHGHPETEKIANFRRIAPAVGNAWRLRKRISQNEQMSGTPVWFPDHLPWSIFALDAFGMVSGSNASAQTMLERRDVVEIADGTLRALHRGSATAFCELIRTGLAGTASETLVEVKSGGLPRIAQILPVNPSRIAAPVQVVALVYIQDAANRSRKIGAVLGRLYGFTPAEMKLADILATGIDLFAAAEELGLSRNTVRNRLQSMYAKSGTRRKSEFLVKVLGLLD